MGDIIFFEAAQSWELPYLCVKGHSDKKLH